MLSEVDARDALILCDAQTSGGLLAAVTPSEAGALCDALVRAGCEDTRRIGTVTAEAGRLTVRP